MFSHVSSMVPILFSRLIHMFYPSFPLSFFSSFLPFRQILLFFFFFSFWLSSSLPLILYNFCLYFLNTCNSKSPFTFLFSSSVSLQGKENYLITECVNGVTPTTYMSFLCNAYTHAPWFFAHKQMWLFCLYPVTSIIKYTPLFSSWPDRLSQSKYQTGLYD